MSHCCNAVRTSASPRQCRSTPRFAPTANTPLRTPPCAGRTWIWASWNARTTGPAPSSAAPSPRCPSTRHDQSGMRRTLSTNIGNNIVYNHKDAINPIELGGPMPRFDLISMEEAMMKSATGKRAEIAREYLSYIEQLRSGWAGKLQASEGESVTAIRRRLTSAAKIAGRSLVSQARRRRCLLLGQDRGVGHGPQARQAAQERDVAPELPRPGNAAAVQPRRRTPPHFPVRAASCCARRPSRTARPLHNSPWRARSWK